jgi:hypothetical protein
MISGIEIKALNDTPQVRALLIAMLIEVVADGASVHFLYPLSTQDAATFW